MALQRLACFGDSLFAGYGLPAARALPARLEALLRADGRELRALNLGISGETSADGLRRLDDVLATVPRATLLEFGANDCHQLVPPEETEDNLAAMATGLRRAGSAVLLVGVRALPWVDEAYGQEFQALFPRLSTRLGLPLYPDILVPYFGNPALTLPDGLHPNSQGVDAMTASLLPWVEALLDGPA
ncbi:GDSL-type esterase/lipase family protein [Desulfovibrio aminophilus]|uniref:arylesterase n=1 Tax=Desulfovibrio aminophilus TaxID=81425 RepID=UPI003391ED30